MSPVSSKSKSHHRFERLETQPVPADPPPNEGVLLQDEYYINGYCKLASQDEFYAKNVNGAEMYSDPAVYARKRMERDGVEQFIEFPAKDENGKEQYLLNGNGYVIYPINTHTKDPIFPINPDTNEEEYISVGGQYRYPLKIADGSAFPIYLKASNGDNIVIRDEATGNEIYYLKNENGDEVYPKDSQGNEKYIRVGYKELGATLRRGGQYYAKNASGGEYYPRRFGPLVRGSNPDFLPPPGYMESSEEDEVVEEDSLSD